MHQKSAPESHVTAKAHHVVMTTTSNVLNPNLVLLMKLCLQDIPDQRPSTDELLTTLQRMKVEVEGEYGGPVKLDMVRVRLAKEVKSKDTQIKELVHHQVSYWHV